MTPPTSAKINGANSKNNHRGRNTLKFVLDMGEALRREKQTGDAPLRGQECEADGDAEQK